MFKWNKQPEMNSKERFELELIEKNIKPKLKELGFKKSGLNWNKKINDIVSCFNIQFSSSTNLIESKFTFNLGVFSYFAYQMVEESEFEKEPKEIDCFIRRRIGNLLLDKKDKWYIIKNSGKDDLIAASQDFTDSVVPFLEFNQNYFNIVQTLKKENNFTQSITAAIFLSFAGQFQESDGIFNNVIVQFQSNIDKNNNKWHLEHSLRIWERTKDKRIKLTTAST